MEPRIVNTSPAVEPLRQRDDDRDRRGGGDTAAGRTLFGSPSVASAMLEQVIETSLSGICIIDQQGYIAFANRALLATWGYDQQDLIGKPAEILWFPRREGPDLIGSARSIGRWSGTVVARRKDSSLFDAQVSVSTIHEPETAYTWLLLSCLDATVVQRTAEGAPGHRRNLELAIAAMPARFMDPTEIDQAIDDSLEDLGRACGACRAYLSLFNDPRTLLGTTHEWCMPAKKPHRGEFQKFLTSDLPWWVVRILEDETVLVDGKTGKGRPARQEREFLKRHGITATLMIPLRLETMVVGFVGFDLDTEGARFTDEDAALLHAAVHIIAGALERKQSEYAFRESENLYRIVLDAITDAITVVDTRFTILLANDAFIARCEEFELETNVAGKNLFSVLPFLSPAVRQQYERVIRTGRSLTSDRSFRIGDQILTFQEIRIPIFERGEVTRVITVTRDITAQREVEVLKSKAYAQIERNMEQFALLADRIRNPLQAIMGYAELIDDPGVTEKIRQQVQRIDAIIDQLDGRWAESRKLSMFWRRYS